MSSIADAISSSQAPSPVKKNANIRYVGRAFFLGFVLLTNTGFIQKDWDNYLVRTLKQVITQHEKLVLESNGYVFSADTFPSRVDVIYTGKVRKVSAERKKFIVEYFKSRGLEEDIPNLFESELLFKAESVEYWLPVQKQVVPYFSEELKERDKVNLFVIWIGAINKNGSVDWIFLVNEFSTIAPRKSREARVATRPLSR